MISFVFFIFVCLRPSQKRRTSDSFGAVPFATNERGARVCGPSGLTPRAPALRTRRTAHHIDLRRLETNRRRRINQQLAAQGKGIFSGRTIPQGAAPPAWGTWSLPPTKNLRRYCENCHVGHNLCRITDHHRHQRRVVAMRLSKQCRGASGRKVRGNSSESRFRDSTIVSQDYPAERTVNEDPCFGHASRVDSADPDSPPPT